MRKLAFVVGGTAFSIAAFHFGYAYVTGECPCRARRVLQFQLGKWLMRELDWEHGLIGSDDGV